VLLQFVDPNVLTGNKNAPLREGETRVNPLHMLVDMANPYDYSTQKNQLILAKELSDHCANVNVNAVSIPDMKTPLHNACYRSVVTNLDVVEYLLETGADPNSQDHLGKTPLMYTAPFAPDAANFLLKLPTTDVNIPTRSGASLLSLGRSLDYTHFANIVALPVNPDRVQHQFLLQQWREIEEMLVERGAHDTGVTAFE
jgi:ankyrin repeat protein